MCFVGTEVMHNPPNSKKAPTVELCGLDKMFPGFNRHLPAKCSVFLLLFGAERYQPLETVVPYIRQH
jgi:hypothetical protein